MSKFAIRARWCAVPVVGLALAGCGGGIPGNAVVSVNGSAITKATFSHWMTVAASASSAATAAQGQTAPKAVVPDPPTYKACIAHLEATAPKPVKGQSKPTAAALKTQCEQQYTSLKQQVLGYLISADWVIGEANERGVKLSDKEVTKELAKEINQARGSEFKEPGSFEKFLTSTGYTISDLLLRTKLTLLSTKIQQKVSKEAGKKPTQKEIQSYYNQHKSQYGKQESRNLRIVLTKTEAQAKSAKKEIESGKSFASVAKAHSIDPSSKSSGGELPGVVKGQEQKALNEAVFAAKQSVLSGPVKTPFGYYIFEVKKIIAGSQEPLSKVQATISQQISATKQQKSLSEFVKNFRTKWTKRTDCRSGYSVQDCKGYKAPKTPAAPVTPSTATATPQTTTTPAPTTGAKKK